MSCFTLFLIGMRFRSTEKISRFFKFSFKLFLDFVLGRFYINEHFLFVLTFVRGFFMYNISKISTKHDLYQVTKVDVS